MSVCIRIACVCQALGVMHRVGRLCNSHTISMPRGRAISEQRGTEGREELRGRQKKMTTRIQTETERREEGGSGTSINRQSISGQSGSDSLQAGGGLMS